MLHAVADQSTGGAQGSTTQESAAQSDAAQGSATSDNTEKTKIIVATTGTGSHPLLIFQGDDGNLDGYDIAVSKETSSDFHSMSWSSRRQNSHPSSPELMPDITRWA